MMAKKLFTVWLLTIVCTAAFAQGILTGKVTDSVSKEALPIANVALYKKGVLKAGAQTDFDGIYRIAEIDAGTYDVEFSAIGYEKSRHLNVQLSDNQIISLNAELKEDKQLTFGVSIVAAKMPIVRTEQTSQGLALTSKQIQNLPIKDLNGIVGVSASVTVDKEGKTSMRGSRPDGTAFYIDGIRVSSTNVLSTTAVATADVEKNSILLEQSQAKNKAGRLTAGEWNDLQNWDFWLKSIDNEFSTHHKYWKYNFENRYLITLTGNQNQAIVDAQISLTTVTGKVIWQARTDNYGKAVLWSGLFDAKQQHLILNVLHNGKTSVFKKIQTGVNALKINAICNPVAHLDLAFVVDGTGSMGDEIAYLKTEMADVLQRVKTNHPTLQIGMSSVFYRDHLDNPVTQIFPFGNTLKQNLDFIQTQEAHGGGYEIEEAVPEGLSAAIDSLQWSEQAIARILFLILDAPPHPSAESIEKMHQLSLKAAQKGIRIIPITASGIDKNVEYLMKALGVVTGGTYVFLTNDSGIGENHIEATTEQHKVEFLNDLMVRLIGNATNLEDCHRGTAKETNLNIQISPNPATFMVSLELKKEMESLHITNAQGQLMGNWLDLKAGTLQIEVSTWTNGVYFATFKQGNTVLTEKFSVIH